MNFRRGDVFSSTTGNGYIVVLEGGYNSGRAWWVLSLAACKDSINLGNKIRGWIFYRDGENWDKIIKYNVYHSNLAKRYPQRKAV